MKTFSAKAEQVVRKWHVIDAEDQIVGRVAETVANVIRGKNKPIYTPHCDTGDFVVIINAEKAVFTGKKETKKGYMSFSGYIGGHKTEMVDRRRARRPELLLESAVKGMVPHNRLGRQMLKKVHIYNGPEHPHTAQNPQKLTIRRPAKPKKS
jgi:large subunit ribosomal protein L13